MLKVDLCFTIGNGSHSEFINEYATNSPKWKRNQHFFLLNVIVNFRILDYRDDSRLNSLRKEVFELKKPSGKNSLNLFVFFSLWKCLNMLKCVKAFIKKKI
jgi:hypothetical protein